MATSTARAPTLAHAADLSHRPTTLPPRSPIPSSSSPATSAALNALRSTPRSASLDWARPRQHSPVVVPVPPPRPSSSTSTRPPPHPPLAPAEPLVRPPSPPLPKVKREAYVVPPIPPFRGAAGTSSAPTLVEVGPAAVAPRAGPSAVPASLAQADQAPRRVSYPAVFSLPRQDQRGGPSGGRASCSAAVTTGLGIAGVGVGAGGAREALVIERVGEGPAAAASRRGDLEEGAAAAADGGARRGSLKRVLISDGEDELAAVRRPASSGDEGMVASSSFPPPRRPPPPPPPLVHRQSDPVVTTHRPRTGSSSPNSSSAANKRRRTSRPTPLDSLATTATDLLAAAPPPSTSTAAQGGIPLSTLVLGQPVQEQHERELERRRSSASQASSAPQAPAPVPSSRRGSVVAPPPEPAVGSSGLAKRRGHRPPTVATGPPLPPGPATHRGLFSAAHGDTPFSAMRSAPVDIPSVLVGSPMEATFAARARERASFNGAELPPMRNGGGPSSSAREPGPPPRRQSQGAVHPQPPLVSSSTYYIRPNQPLGPGHSFPPPPPSTATSPRSSAPPKDQGRNVRLPSLTRSTGSGRPPHQHHHAQHSSQSSMQGYHLHHPQLHAQHPSSSSSAWHGPPPPGGPLSPLPPLGESMPAPGAPGGPPLPSPAFTTLPPHSAGLAPHAPYHHGARPGSSHGAPPPPLHPPTSSHGQHGHPSAPSPSTKQAFLSLFSNFYDSLSDSRVLTASLDQQLVRAGQLLTTLQQAEQALDAAVLDVRREGERRWAAIEERLVRLEGGGGRVGGAAPTGLEARLAKLERMLLDREVADGVRRHSGDSTTSSGGVADSEASTGAVEARDEDMAG
ncbi:hypothetical protein JCM8208_007125 [Rhodotorula glutinis]